MLTTVNDKVAIFKSFNDTLQFKSTAQDIMSQAKNGLCDDPWFMRALDDVAKIHPFVSGSDKYSCSCLILTGI